MLVCYTTYLFFFFFQAEDGIRDKLVTGVQTCALPISAFAAAAVGIDGHVADLAGDVGGAVIDLAVEHDAAADPGADREADDVVRPARRAPPPFAENGAVRVVVEGGGQSQRLHDAVPQREIGPAEVRGQQHHAARRVERARRADSHARDLLAAGRGDRGAGELHDARHDCVRALLGERRLRYEPEELRAVLRDRPGDDVRPADVNPDDVAHRSPRWRRARDPRTAPACT